ncbi:HAMP domain-containing sensor histidine kinase [Streptosporangium sp. NPDC051022]|uniref:sensor histidine kinase n=1 Tax=Streptosporangium sp. NPDC051022 TaxID=3155752 RepID=UPI0034437454
MRPGSLRWKVAALIALACIAVVGVVGLLVHGRTLDRSMLDQGGRALDWAEEVTKQYHEGIPSGGPDMWSKWIRSADELPSALRAELASESPTTWYDGEGHDDMRGEQRWMWAVQWIDKKKGLVAVAQMDMSADIARLRALDRAMLRAALIALAVVVPVSVALAEPVNRRLRRVAVTARRIADGDLDARITPKGKDDRRGWAGRDEITDISTAVDSMAASLQYRLLAEQRFTADVAHDLRTPLMGLVAAAELLEEGEATELVRDRVRVLRSLVEDLLEISRLDSGAEAADRVRVPLAELAEQSVARLGVEAWVLASGDPVAETDPRRLDRILANLVLNAQRHGGSPVEITVRDHAIEVRDRGPGFPPEILADGPRRFRTGAAERGHGHGLGLTIALGQAGVIGADLTLANAPGGGAVATLRLPRQAAGSPG